MSTRSPAPLAQAHYERPPYRLYIDEVGNADMDASSDDPNHRYLSLTGVIIHRDHVRHVLKPAFEYLKRRYTNCDPDEPIIFHRKELMRGEYPFEALRDPVIRAEFDAELLAILQKLEYQVITSVIDKYEHQRLHGHWAFHPYHYCMAVIIERFVMELRPRGMRGDVMAEGRGKREDQALCEAFARIYQHGSGRMHASQFQDVLSSKELKIKRKAADIAGLQLADLVALPSFRAMQHSRNGTPMRDDFSKKVAEILERSKYRRALSGAIDSFGRKWLP